METTNHPIGALHTMLLTDYKRMIECEHDWRAALMRIAYDSPDSPGAIAFEALRKHRPNA